MITTYDSHLKDFKSKRFPSKLEELFALHLLGSGLELMPVREYKFHPERRWRFDFCFPESKLAIEIDGGTWSGGRHTTGIGFRNDCEKMNNAVLLGWRMLRFTADQVRSGEALRVTLEALK